MLQIIIIMTIYGIDEKLKRAGVKYLRFNTITKH